jgi:phenylacetate-CoA ligase
MVGRPRIQSVFFSMTAGADLQFDLGSLALQETAYSARPMTILEPGETKAALAVILEIALVETGDKAAREHWQQNQLDNLFNHSRERSAFWRKRIGDGKGSDLRALPPLTRQQLVEQVAAEGCLLTKADQIPVSQSATSGSSGMPVRFFISAANGQYNFARWLAQYFIEGRDLSLNRTWMREDHGPKTAQGPHIERSDSWLGPLAPLFKSGANKTVTFRVADFDKIGAELLKDDVGYLVCPPRVLETVLSLEDPEILHKAKTARWIGMGEAAGEHLIDVLRRLRIPFQSTYSSEEIGPIGYECAVQPGYYHVASSNVVVETEGSYYLDGQTAAKLLVTGLHSYATPLIRYDLGDLGCLRDSCPCGHGGPTIYNLTGRVSALLKHPDGRITPLHIRARELTPLVDCTEYRLRQTALDKIVVEIGGRTELTGNELSAVEEFVKLRAGPEFSLDIRPCPAIDWGPSLKRPTFRCEIA